MLTTWKLTGFKELSEDYEKRLAEIEKSFPPPKKE
jgi:hypothetical protein